MTDIGTASISPRDIPHFERYLAEPQYCGRQRESLFAVIVRSALMVGTLLGGPGLPTAVLAAPATASDTRQAAENTRQIAADSWITTQLKSRLLADEASKDFPIGVETTAGVVVLKGGLPNQDSVDHVKYLAESIAGVNSVNTSALKILPK